MPPSPRTTPLRLAIVNGMPGFDGAEVWMLDSAAALTAPSSKAALTEAPAPDAEDLAAARTELAILEDRWLELETQRETGAL